jgi:hypothetical protein
VPERKPAIFSSSRLAIILTAGIHKVSRSLVPHLPED